MGEGRHTGDTELTFPLPAADGVTVDRRNELILVRWDSEVFAFALSCPHQRTMLKWRESDQRFQCPKHKSKYRPDGVFLSGRATRGMDRYALRLEGDGLHVDTRVAIHQDENEPAWNAAAVRLPSP
jgi:Rieske Fe-S protein